MSFYKNETDAKPFSVVVPTVQQKITKMTGGSKINEKKMEKIKPDINQPRFTERHHLNLDEIFEYQRNGSDPGTVLIFNQEIFDDASIPIRRGSRRDVNEIIICFQRLGFNIYEANIHKNLSVDEILLELDSVVNDKEALKNTNCLLVFFLTHGHSNEELHARDGTLNSSEIWRKFVHCDELKHKPKMFVFQACKGDFYTTTSGQPTEVNYNDNPSKIVNFNNFSANQLGEDMLVVYATTEGNLSFRNPLTGTWFIQELCKIFSSYGRRDDVISMITRTIKCVSGNYFNLDDEEYKSETPEIQKQMPVFVSTLSKKFYLNRNKDRNVLLNIQKETQEIHKLVNEITKCIKPDAAVKSKK